VQQVVQVGERLVQPGGLKGGVWWLMMTARPRRLACWASPMLSAM
jgi:hypothetical protein